LPLLSFSTKSCTFLNKAGLFIEPFTTVEPQCITHVKGAVGSSSSIFIGKYAVLFSGEMSENSDADHNPFLYSNWEKDS
jgi:hypothetical protein